MKKIEKEKALRELEVIMDSLNPKLPIKEEYNPFLNKKPSAPYNQEQLNFIYEKIRMGFKTKYLSDIYNIDHTKLNKRIKSNDWTSVRNRRDNALSLDELLEIKQKVDDGVPYENIIKEYNISLVALQNRIINNKWERPKRKNQYNFNEEYFDIINDEHKAYWLGFLMADGYILSKRERKDKKRESQSFGFSISVNDSEMFDKFKKDLESNNPVHFYNNYSTYENSTKVGRILLTSQHTVDSLKKWGIVEQKTYITKMPNIPKDLIPAFIRGYSDGDGSIVITYQEKFCWSLTGTKELLTDILKFLGKENLKLSQRWPERNNNNYSVTIYGRNQVPNLLDIIYKDATIYMERKYNKYLQMKKIKKDYF